MSQSPSQFDVSFVNGAQQCDCWRHRSSSLVCDKKERKVVITDVAIPGDDRVKDKELEKLEKY